MLLVAKRIIFVSFLIVFEFVFIAATHLTANLPHFIQPEKSAGISRSLPSTCLSCLANSLFDETALRAQEKKNTN